jgi:ribonuclease J
MLKLIPLGGLGEIGLNMMVLEYEEDIILVDAGLMFPEEYMPGVDLVIPDVGYLLENREKVKNLVLTHGHEDHIGAIPFLLKDFPHIPIYGTNFTLELLKEKLREHGLLENTFLNKVKAGNTVQFGPFTIEFIRVNHSIVDGVGLAIQTPEGTIIHTGDFKIDQTPVDGIYTDLARFSYYGQQDILLLLSDSTNIEKEGFTLSEKEVSRTIEELFISSKGRLIIAAFASNITRIQQIINLASKYKRKVLFSGKSMVTNVQIAKAQGYIDLPEDIEIKEKEVASLPDDEITMITTGSQGEPMSSLTRMSQNTHKHIQVKPGDTIILSSRFIPGNESAITRIINNLYRLGAEVIYEKVSDIHSSGHAYKEELKLMLNLIKPRHFIPIHGDYRHLVKHTQLAKEMGVPEDQVLLVKDGDCVCFEKRKAWISGSVHSGRILVDGKGVGDVGDLVLKDRRILSGDGLVIALIAVDNETGHIIYGPDIISRGFVFEEEIGYILEDAKCIVLEVVEEMDREMAPEWPDLADEIKRQLKRFFYKVIKRRPLILPMIIPV